MKTVECIRCHRLIRLDEYKAHLATCGVAEQPVKTSEPVINASTDRQL